MQLVGSIRLSILCVRLRTARSVDTENYMQPIPIPCRAEAEIFQWNRIRAHMPGKDYSLPRYCSLVPRYCMFRSINETESSGLYNMRGKICGVNRCEGLLYWADIRFA
ncbi:hypothetical protein DFH27DRAFT_545124 [Peziza echinospora]|nr:hypothetical protein DFH27DRAFT_545124 [Peziza echinospora]